MSQPLRVASPPPKPLMVYDGDCNFCRRWIARWQGMTDDAVDYIENQAESIPVNFPEIPRTDFEQAVHLIMPDGSVYSGAEAVYRSLAAAGREKWLLKLYTTFPGFEEISELIYEEVAAHRTTFSTLDRIYSGPGVRPLSYVWTRYWFLRGLAVIYLIAFASLWPQINGLSGSHGIVPIRSYLEVVRHVGLDHWRVLPTISLWNDSDAALSLQCGAGVGLSILLLFGIAPAPVLFLLWILYLSLTTVCTPFLNFQWDQLLLETGFLAIFLAPLQLIERPARQSSPSFVVLWLLRWLAFRLMLESGCVKLLSSDPTWWHLSALRVHYETQPLPTWIGWHAHQFPFWFQRLSVVIMFIIELAGPILIFSGRRGRITAAVAFIFLQVVIMLTGNYTFFNWLTILLCIPLLDDRVLKFGRKIGELRLLPFAQRCRRWPRRVVFPIAAVLVTVTLMDLTAVLHMPQPWPGLLIALHNVIQPFRSANSYGLFAVMTTVRPEIIIEGSNDGKTWVPYEFKYKPGDLKQAPRFVAPFQPRLDWQMWFAALGTPHDNPWFLNFIIRLLDNTPQVTALLAKNPFPNAPPKFIRAELYEYHFTDPATRRATGQWWKREYFGLYLPPVSSSPNEHATPVFRNPASNAQN